MTYDILRMRYGVIVVLLLMLVISGDSVAFVQEKNQDKGISSTGTYELETPAWPVNPPDNWLTYHLSHPGPGVGFPGDPNPAYYYKGRYHLHYIYENMTGFVYAHVSSTDMVHWKWHPTVLTPAFTGHGMFSGTGFFTKEGQPAMIYFGYNENVEEEDLRIWLMYALDDNLDKWTKPEMIVPKDDAGKEVELEYHDPDLWLMGDTYYAMSGGNTLQHIMKSKDLKNWKYIGPFFHKDYPERKLGVSRTEDLQCVNTFKIGNKWMVLGISHPMGCRYYLGDFKGDQYLPDFHANMNWTEDGPRQGYFAPESLLTPDGRRVVWAWIRGMELSPEGVQALPRELELPADGVLRMKPLRELEKLRYDRKQEKNITVKSEDTYALKGLTGDALELKITFSAPVPEEFGLNLLGAEEDGKGGMRIIVGADKKVLTVGNLDATFELKKGEDLTLRIFIDKNLVEVFANDRQAVSYAHKQDIRKNPNISLFAKGSDLKVKKVTAWKMKSTHYTDPIHFKPKLPTKKTVGDVMPFYWKGEYHIFYLTNPMGNYDVSWEHCSSKDLVNWKEYPTALKPELDDPTGPDGCCIFTGCIVHKDGIFHAWYTSWNPKNPDGREFISHATSKDLISWTKHPEHTIGPDGVHFQKHQQCDFRDPQIFWNDEKKEYWMHLLVNAVGIRGESFGLLTSKDLIHWKQEGVVKIEGESADECPDYFKIGDTHYIHAISRYFYADNIEGPYRLPKVRHEIDRPAITAPKRVWDGKRHVWFGSTWHGHVMTMPREIYAGPEGLLYIKPVDEILDLYKKTVVDLSGKPLPKGEIKVPEHYLLDCELEVAPKTVVSIDLGGMYSMTLDTADGRMMLEGKGFEGADGACPVDVTKPVKIQIFTEGNLIECFVNDQFAKSCVVAKPLANYLKIAAKAGKTQALKLKVKTTK